MGESIAAAHRKFEEIVAQSYRKQKELNLQYLERIREILEKSLSDHEAPRSIQKGTSRKQIAGYDCEQYTVSKGTMTISEELVAPDLQVPLYFEYLKARLGDLTDADEMRTKGFPLAITGQRFTAEAIEVKKEPIDASMFVVPPGYIKVESPIAKYVSTTPERK